MKWSFELSFMVFLIIAFLSYAIEIKSKSRLSLPFTLGIICIIGFGTGFFPRDFIVESKMKEIGIIAFNVLVINSGTMIDFKALKPQRKNILISVISIVIMSIVILLGVGPFIGREFGAMSLGPLVGGGAAAAISSISIIRVNPELEVFPWLIFMVQCFFAIPLCSYLIKKESQIILNDYKKSEKKEVIKDFKGDSINQSKVILCDKIPAKYKTTAYYLGTLMIVSVFNRWLNGAFLMEFGININISALIFGIVLGNSGILERGPLLKSNTMGFLMLGLMALMADTLANTPISLLSSLVIPLIIVTSTATLVLIIVGIVASKIYNISIYRGIIISLIPMAGFPMNLQLVEEVSNKICTKDEEKKILKRALNPMISSVSIVIVNVVSILLSSSVLLFL